MISNTSFSSTWLKVLLLYLFNRNRATRNIKDDTFYNSHEFIYLIPIPPPNSSLYLFFYFHLSSWIINIYNPQQKYPISTIDSQNWWTLKYFVNKSYKLSCHNNQYREHIHFHMYVFFSQNILQALQYCGANIHMLKCLYAVYLRKISWTMFSVTWGQ